LQWLTFSARPLRVEEVAEVVALEIEREPAFEPDEILEDPLDALKICSSLVTIPRLDVERSKRWKRLFADEDGFSPDIVLAHYSVKEYLISDRICQDLAPKYSINESRCNALIAERCLKYLLRFQNQIPFDADKDNVSRIYKLAQYSAVFWMEHVVRAKTNVTSLQTSIMELFSGAGTAYLTWVMLYEPIQPQGAYWPTDLGRVPAPLYYASLAGMTDIVALLLANETGGRFHSALQAASVDGHAKIAERLMQAGANVNAEDGSYDSALQAASSYGHVKIVQLLLQAGANVNAEGGGFGSALQAASMIGHEKVVEQLLQAGANADTQSDEFGSVLQSASMCGYEKVVKQLLQAGANVNAQSGEFGGALQAASMSGHEKVIKQLLQAGANVNAEGRLGSALHWGTSRGNEEVVKLLLQAGADVHAKDGLRGSALHLASELGHIKIMEILVQAGADVNQQCPGVGVPLDVAVRNFETEAIKWLIQAGAKTDRDEVLDEICELGCDIDHRT
jgi:ankyrin repeat protein